MAGDNKELKIGIGLEVSGNGAHEARKEVEGVSQATDELAEKVAAIEKVEPEIKIDADQVETATEEAKKLVKTVETISTVEATPKVNTAGVEAVGKAAEKAKRPVKEVGDEVAQIGPKSAGANAATKTVDELGKTAERSKKPVKELGDAVEDVKKKKGTDNTWYQALIDQVPGLGRVVDLLKGGGVATKALIGLLASLAVAAVAAFAQMISSGTRFNSTLEDSQLGIAAVLKQFDDTGKFESFDDAMVASAEAIEMLKREALSSPATFEQLVQAYQGAAGSMASSGMTVEQQIKTIVTMSQTLAGLGIQSGQILQETRAILTGNITEDAAAARILGITREMIMTAKEEGNLYEFLQQKTAAFAEAGARSAETLTTKMSNLQDSFQQISAQASRPFFEGLKRGADEASRALGFLKSVMDYLSPPAPAAAKGVNEIAVKAKEAELSVRELNNARVDELQKSAENAGKAFDKLEANIKKAAAQADALDEAETKRALAQLDTDEQAALAGAGDDEARQRIQNDFNTRRRSIQTDREDRRSSRSIEAEKQIATEIAKQLAEQTAKSQAANDEVSRARANTAVADTKAREAGIWPEHQMGAGQVSKFMQFLEEDLADAREAAKATKAKWFGETGRQNPGQAQKEIAASESAIRDLEAKRKAAQDLLAAQNYEKTAEENAKTAGAATEKFQAEAQPRLDEANANVSRLKLEQEAQALKAQADTRRQAAQEQEQADNRRIRSLEDEAAIMREQNQTALDALTARGATESEIAKQRADGNERERELQLEIARIRGEADKRSALNSEDRKQDLLAIAEAARRAREAQEKKDAADLKKEERKTARGSGGAGGRSDRTSAPERVRGAVTSDSFERDTPLNESALDAHKNRQPGMAGYRPPGYRSGDPSALTPTPGLPGAPAPGANPSQVAGAPAGQDGQGAGTAAADAAKKLTEELASLKTVAEEIKKATSEVAGAKAEIISAATALTGAIAALKASVEALRRAA